MIFAHILGLPVEETLLAAVPLAGLGLAALAAGRARDHGARAARAVSRTARPRPGSRPRTRGARRR